MPKINVTFPLLAAVVILYIAKEWETITTTQISAGLCLLIVSIYMIVIDVKNNKKGKS